MYRLHYVLAVLGVIGLSGCLEKPTDALFVDQHFKTAVSLIELHKVRQGTYPENLQSLKFTGPWDGIALRGVEYQRVDGGYELNLAKRDGAIPDLSYPPEFWKGLGMVKTNVKRN